MKRNLYERYIYQYTSRNSLSPNLINKYQLKIVTRYDLEDKWSCDRML